MRFRRHEDSNLFAIDCEAIKKVLAEANSALLRRRDNLLAALARAPDPLTSAEDVLRAQRFAALLKEAIEETRAARISDGRPFQLAAAAIKSFFDEIDKPLRNASREILNRLTEAAHRMRSTPPEPSHPAAISIGMDASGETVVAAAAPRPAQTGISLVWVVEGFDRAALDLEALREFLTDDAILRACRKRLAQHGPQAIAGVRYREVAAAE